MTVCVAGHPCVAVMFFVMLGFELLSLLFAHLLMLRVRFGRIQRLPLGYVSSEATVWSGESISHFFNSLLRLGLSHLFGKEFLRGT